MTRNEYLSRVAKLERDAHNSHYHSDKRGRFSEAWRQLFHDKLEDMTNLHNEYEDDAREREYDRREDEAVDKWRGAND